MSAELRLLSSKSRIERYFPAMVKAPGRVLLLHPEGSGAVPPLDLLKLSTFLKKRGYTTQLSSVHHCELTLTPSAVVLTSVFSWEIPTVRSAVSELRGRWPDALIILSGVLPRKLGDEAQDELGAAVLDEQAEIVLDEEAPDYSLCPEWDASILITSKGVCPRECSHCETAARGKGVARLIRNWRAQLDPRLPRVEIWDNTLMLTPRDHFCAVVETLIDFSRPVDLVCGLTPNGIEETELMWRINHLSRLHLSPVRLECNLWEEMPRFLRLLQYARSAFGAEARFRCFAVINGTEPPEATIRRIQRIKAEPVSIDLVHFTPHEWEQKTPYLNRAMGWCGDTVAACVAAAAS